MHPIVSEHAFRVLNDKNELEFINALKQNWIFKLFDYFDSIKLGSYSSNYPAFTLLEQFASTLSSTECRLQTLQGTDDISTLRRKLLGVAYKICDSIGNIKDAIQYIERVVNVEGPYSEDILDFAGFANEIGITLLKGAMYSDSENFFEISLELLNDLSNLHVKNPLYSESYSLKELVTSDYSELYGSVFLNLGSLYESWNKDKKAVNCFSTSSHIFEEVLGNNHPNTLYSYNKIAGCLRKVNDDEGALKICKKAEKAFKSNTDQKTALIYSTIYNNMAKIYVKRKEYKEAQRYFNKCINISTSLFGEKHPEIAFIHSNIAFMYREQDQYREAIFYYLKALPVFEEKMGYNHPDTIDTYISLAFSYDQLDEYENTIYYCKKAILAIQSTNYESDQFSIYNNPLINLQLIITVMESALQKQRTILGENHPFVQQASTFLNNIKFTIPYDHL